MYAIICLMATLVLYQLTLALSTIWHISVCVSLTKKVLLSRLHFRILGNDCDKGNINASRSIVSVFAIVCV